MVKKFIYTLSGEYVNPTYLQDKRNDLLNLNNILHNELIHNKNNITCYHKNRKWDRYKKLTNDYELVFTSTQGCASIANYNPLSRSYFKLWEILEDFNNEIALPKEAIKAVFLADAPGGFGEAFINQRKQQCVHDELYGMSLRASNKIIPNWKFNGEYCNKHNINLFYGKSGTGNLYDMNNIEDLVENVSKNSCMFVTADGGFDFSSDFNNQEDMSLRLIMCEVFTALNIQKEGGTFILKVFDLHNLTTMKLVYILKMFYGNVSFIKPLSSRPANSEKYIVCTNFKLGTTTEHTKALRCLKSDIKRCETTNILKDFAVPNEFIMDLVEYNRIYIGNQISHIVRTVHLIENLEKYDTEEVVKQQVRKAIKWCHKYKIPISVEALHKYKKYYL